MDKVRIGPSGNSEIFYKNGYKRSIDAPKFLNSIGLSAYEYSFGRGFTMGIDMAKELGQKGKEHNISISIHAPYYINFANPSDEMIEKSIAYVVKSLQYANYMNANKVVVHTGSVGKQTRGEALERVRVTLKLCLDEVYKNFDMTNKFICLETMGKYQQIGTYQEIVALCKLDKCLIPTYDFGHINCILQGNLKTKQDYRTIFDYSIEKLGIQKIQNCHIHFSKIEYSAKGEIRHLTLDNKDFGPEFEPLVETVIDLDLKPSIICESSGMMMEDAVKMNNIYNSFKTK